MSARILLLLGITFAALVPGPAQAWRHGGWWGPGVFIAIVTDPDGNWVEFLSLR